MSLLVRTATEDNRSLKSSFLVRPEHEEAEVAADAVLPVVLRAGDVRRPRRRLPGQPRAAQRHRGLRALAQEHQRRHQARAAGTQTL